MVKIHKITNNKTPPKKSTNTVNKKGKILLKHSSIVMECVFGHTLTHTHKRKSLEGKILWKIIFLQIAVTLYCGYS